MVGRGLPERCYAPGGDDKCTQEATRSDTSNADFSRPGHVPVSTSAWYSKVFVIRHVVQRSDMVGTSKRTEEWQRNREFGMQSSAKSALASLAASVVEKSLEDDRLLILQSPFSDSEASGNSASTDSTCFCAVCRRSSAKRRTVRTAPHVGLPPHISNRAVFGSPTRCGAVVFSQATVAPTCPQTNFRNKNT